MNKNIETVHFTTNNLNIRYQTGVELVHGNEIKAVFLLPDGKKIAITDQRYKGGYVEKTCEKNGVELIILESGKGLFNIFDSLLDRFKNEGITKFGLEGEYITFNTGLKIQKIINANGLELIVHDSFGPIERLRMIKSDFEIKCIQKACLISIEILKQIKQEFEEGISEDEIANKIRKKASEMSDGISFDPIVAFGENAGIPHHKPGERRLAKGDIALIDMGAKHKGYCSDISRTYFTNTPSKNQLLVYNTVLLAKKAVEDAIAKGENNTNSLSLIANKVMNEAGFEDIPHALGHGLGLFIHEKPTIGTSSNGGMKIENRTAFTNEPGIYMPDKQIGVRLEDTLVLTSDGLQNLTKSMPLEVEVLDI